MVLRLQCSPMRKGAVPLRRDSGSNEWPWESLPIAIKRRSAERSPATSRAVFLLQKTESTLINMNLIWSRHPVVIFIFYWVSACVLSIFVYMSWSCFQTNSNEPAGQTRINRARNHTEFYEATSYPSVILDIDSLILFSSTIDKCFDTQRASHCRLFITWVVVIAFPTSTEGQKKEIVLQDSFDQSWLRLQLDSVLIPMRSEHHQDRFGSDHWSWTWFLYHHPACAVALSCKYVQYCNFM